MKFRLRSESVLWFVAALLLILSTNFFWMEQSARVVAPLHRCVLSAGHAWQVPLAVWNSNEAYVVWPFYAFALCGATLIAAIASRALNNGAGLWTALLMPGLSFAIQPDQLFTALLVVMTCRLLTAQQSRTTFMKFVFISVMILGFAIVVSLNFGLIALLIIGTTSSCCVKHSMANERSTARRYLMFLVLLLASAFVAILVVHGFAAAFFRPLNWLWRSTDLMPSMKFLSGSPSNMTAHILLGLLILRSVWKILRFEAAVFPRKVTCLVLAAIGLGCGQYTALTAIALCEQSCADSATLQRPIPAIRNLFAIPCVFLILATLNWGWLLKDNGMSAIGGTSQQRLINPTDWQFDGPVMLTNRDQSIDWQAAAYKNKFPLLLDDRWDAETKDLREYSVAVHDLLLGLREHHLKRDSAIGGYRNFLDRHQPVAIVLDSTQVETIRHLSVDPEWRVMSIDSRRTVFGNSKLAATRSQTIRASELFFQLEWPRPNVNMRLEGIIALGSAEDSRAVAMVLIAMRLPYAAIRVLSDDNTSAAETVRSWAYAELAHRAIRHMGQPSLLDQTRAIRGLNKLNSRLLVSVEERERIQRTIASLKNVNVRSVTLNESPDETSESERTVRRAFVEGDLNVAIKAIALIPDPDVRQFYQLLASSDRGVVSDVLEDMDRLLESSKLPSRIREEALFYCGCLELERGDVLAAGGFFHQSHELNSVSQFTAIRRLNLSQIADE